MTLPKMHDGRTPEALIADGDHRWPDGRIYLPPHLTGRERKQFLQHLLLMEPEDSAIADHYRDEFIAASGLVECADCGELYYDHPHDNGTGPGISCLTILCDRSRVKL